MMKACRHGLDADACELCQDDIKAAAAKHGLEARRLPMSAERRAEIARIAAQRQLKDLWSGVAIKPRPWSAERREAASRRERGRWSGVATKRKAVEDILRQNPNLQPEEVAQRVGCSVAHARWIGVEMGVYAVKSRAERARERHAARRLRNLQEGGAWKRIADALQARPTEPYQSLADDLGVSKSQVLSVARRLGMPPRPRGRQKIEITQEQVNQDQALASTVRRVQMLRKKGYAAARIAQLMDLDEKEVRRMLKTEVNAWATRQKARAMTDDELAKAVALWKQGSTNESIANNLGLTLAQVARKLRVHLRQLGEK